MKNNTRIANTKPNFRNHLVTQSPVLNLLRAHGVSPMERCSSWLKPFANRICFATSVRKFANHLITFPKAAFTLAEVLITLAIIGVVAAITIPSLVSKYKEMETVVRVKKFYSVFSQVYQMAILDNGTIDCWGLNDSALTEDDEGHSINDEASIEQVDKFFKIIQPYLKKFEYKKLNMDNTSFYSTERRGYFLPDGTAISAVWLQPSSCVNDSSVCGDFYIVTDGGSIFYDKPNPMDTKKKIRDNVFAFKLLKNRIEPYGLTQEEFETYCLNKENITYCTGWVIKNGNMDYLHCKDLDINTKTKC